MSSNAQLPLFPPAVLIDEQKQKRSGTFVDNIKLPIHRWFRYSAGFSAEWVEALIRSRSLVNRNIAVLDPFVGSGTTLLASDLVNVRSVGIEAHPFVARICAAKLLWDTPVDSFLELASLVQKRAEFITPSTHHYPNLILRSFAQSALMELDSLRQAWLELDDHSAASELIWLALTATLRPSSNVGTAQWQYILPNKKKKMVINPFDGYDHQVQLMAYDMLYFQGIGRATQATVYEADARHFPEVLKNSIDLVVTSPPYANNYDYADALRLEMSFWGDVESWGDLHVKVRRYLIRSSSQHASLDKLDLDSLLSCDLLNPISNSIEETCRALESERLSHGGKKHYHTMIAAYFVDMANMWHELRRVCKTGAEARFVIGESALYGIHVPVETWMGELALSAGFNTYNFEKIRDRNVKWKNRKHRVPLHEGRLWIQG